MFFDMKMPSPMSTASCAPSPCFTSSSSDGGISDLSDGFPDNLTFVLYGRIVSGAMVTSNAHDLITRACERAGLDDFGNEAWREGLNLLVDTVESAPGVNAGGRDYVYGQFIDALWNRLRIVDYRKQHPEVTDEKIERPLVVLGLPRTG